MRLERYNVGNTLTVGEALHEMLKEASTYHGQESALMVVKIGNQNHRVCGFDWKTRKDGTKVFQLIADAGE